jgi:predicted RNA-binding Zn-ribbon protein involved in translation (DUF1610 family)
MFSWLEAGTYCEETYGMTLNVEEGYFVCPECGEPIHEEDWKKHDEWEKCPICGFNFLTEEMED